MRLPRLTPKLDHSLTQDITQHSLRANEPLSRGRDTHATEGVPDTFAKETAKDVRELRPHFFCCRQPLTVDESVEPANPCFVEADVNAICSRAVFRTN